MGLIAARGREGHLQRVGDVLGLFRAESHRADYGAKMMRSYDLTEEIIWS